MNKLSTGEFYGSHYQKMTFGDLIITDTEYTHKQVDWHYHENPYFTLLLQGKLFEGNKKNEYYLTPGSLLFHNWQDAHYNIKPNEFTRGFHIELNSDWFANYDIQAKEFEGSLNLKNPLVKNSMNKIFIESKINDNYSNVGIESLLVDIFSTMTKTKRSKNIKPTWVKRLQELILEEQIDYSLVNLSSILGIHPVHLSREFNRYFGTSISNYIRLLKINKSFNLIVSNQYSLTEVAYRCGFYDQSHFISNFKRVYNMTPSKALKKIG